MPIYKLMAVMILFRRLSQLHLENYIRYGFQRAALRMANNPFQGLKYAFENQVTPL